MNIGTVCITGATGVIGRALVKNLILQKTKIVVFVSKYSQRVDSLFENDLIRIVRADLSEYSNLDCELLSLSCDVFVHLAWQGTFGDSRDNISLQSQNILYSLDAIALAKRMGARKYIGIGSQAEYGITNEVISSYTPTNPISGYGIAKLSSCLLAKKRCAQLDLEFNWVRVLSVFGEGDRENSLIMNLIHCFKRGVKPNCTNAEQIWDYLYSKDAASALLKIAERGANGLIYILGSGRPRRLKDYIESVRKIMAPNISVEYGKIDYYIDTNYFMVADIKDLNKLGWYPAFSFEEGIRDILRNNSNL